MPGNFLRCSTSSHGNLILIGTFTDRPHGQFDAAVEKDFVALNAVANPEQGGGEEETTADSREGCEPPRCELACHPEAVER
jgi:hypothetical protein